MNLDVDGRPLAVTTPEDVLAAVPPDAAEVRLTDGAWALSARFDGDLGRLSFTRDGEPEAGFRSREHPREGVVAALAGFAATGRLPTNVDWRADFLDDDDVRVHRVLAALSAWDPMSLLRMGAPPNEYVPEARDVVERAGEDDVVGLLVDVLTHRFGGTWDPRNPRLRGCGADVERALLRSAMNLQVDGRTYEVDSPEDVVSALPPDAADIQLTVAARPPRRRPWTLRARLAAGRGRLEYARGGETAFRSEDEDRELVVAALAEFAYTGLLPAKADWRAVFLADEDVRVHRVLASLSAWDPLGLLTAGCPADEYLPEARDIVATDDGGDVALLVARVLTRWFSHPFDARSFHLKVAASRIERALRAHSGA